MEYNQKKLQTHLKKLFWINILSIIIATIALMYIIGPFWGESVVQNVVFERYAIIISLICIPLGLKFFHTQVKKAENEERSIYLKKYKNAYYLRFAIMNIAIIFNLVGFYLFESQNLILMALICTFALFFCYTGKNSIRTEEDIYAEDKEENSNNIENLNNE